MAIYFYYIRVRVRNALFFVYLFDKLELSKRRWGEGGGGIPPHFKSLCNYAKHILNNL